MESIKYIYKIGYGPSSSHTMAPRKASLMFKEKHSGKGPFRATLYGSLALTGKGHLTDQAIIEAFHPEPIQIIWKPETFLKKHANALKLEKTGKNGKCLDEWTVYSTGGGTLDFEGARHHSENKYPLSSMNDILSYCKENGISFWEYVEKYDDDDIMEYLSEVWEVMKNAIRCGLENEGRLPGPLNLQRKANSYYVKAKGYRDSLQRRGMVFAYTLAVSEENAGGGRIVTAPTCGSCGVIPGVLYMLKTQFDFTDKKVHRALATAGLIGNLVKKNASISGAEVGCQGEVGTACAMAAAAATQLFGGSIQQIEYSAEMGLEHHLGLTCDPIKGLVQIPCIERNAFAAARALNVNTYSLLSDGAHQVSFDKVVRTMKQTGHDLPSLYKETAEGGLAVTPD